MSQTTVSLVLNNIAGIRIAESTRQNVIETARLKLGPQAIGVVIDDSTSNPIFRMVL